MPEFVPPAIPRVAALHAYTPGLQPQGGGWIKLNTNESPYPASPRVARAVAEAAEGLRKYPHPGSQGLRAALASRHGLDASQVIAGNGSDDILNLLIRAFAGPEHAVGMTVPSYSLYPVLAAIQGAALVEVPLGEHFALPVEAIAACGANLFFLTSPNAPAGTAFATAEIARLAGSFPGLLVVDEAYADFAPEDAVPLLARFPRLVITRTFSKSHALAGLRVGYGLAHPAVIGLLDRVRDSYNVNSLSQAGAIAAVEDAPYYADLIARIKRTRAGFESGLRSLGWFFHLSATNFVFVRPRRADGSEGPPVARSLYDHFVSRKILVRHFPSRPETAAFLRISIGTDADMEAVLQACREWKGA